MRWGTYAHLTSAMGASYRIYIVLTFVTINVNYGKQAHTRENRCQIKYTMKRRNKTRSRYTKK
ncbi:hypothetical protein MACH26_26610 [Planctobacterium marinum]|uniref:Uncharacterized protein n=1 Tax=Planctobacterium marinum TaxID=1631968 RepID=A0AA48I725_9ALTE|nr:hypothetical protein MACH26_26610 [Planctobacterium marinum]